MNTLVLFFSTVFVPENQGEMKKKEIVGRKIIQVINIKLGIIHIPIISVLRKQRQDCQFGLESKTLS